jgi:hypothetical protein
MKTFHANVIIDSVTEYTRTNIHGKRNFEQAMVSITMITTDGNTVLTSYTDATTIFAMSVNVGDNLFIGCKVTEKTDEYGTRLVARNCKIGGFANEASKQARRDKFSKSIIRV